MADAHGPILLIDDNAEILTTTARYLRARGLEVVTSSASLGVSSLVRRHVPSVIVLDVMMPALDGGALARLLHTPGPKGTTPIIFYSAVDEEQLYAVTRKTPGASYVPKSEGLGALEAAIKLALEKSVGPVSRAGNRAEGG
jgi:DNA-binding response OmpR family regulator